MLVLTLSDAVTPGDYISISYFPGYLKGTDGSATKPFGPEGISNPVLDSKTQTLFAQQMDNFKVYPNPTSDVLNIICDYPNYEIKMFNSMGSLVFTDFSGNSSSQIDVSRFDKGIYFIQVIGTGNEIDIQKILVE